MFKKKNRKHFQFQKNQLYLKDLQKITMIKIIEKYPIVTIIVLVLLMMLPNLNSLQVTIMEARNFITAREMLSDGNWFLTTMNGVPRYEKPPLPTWITGFFGLLFGIKSLFALRFPTVIMICVVGVYTYLLSFEMLKSKSQSFVNGLIGITSFYVIAIIIEAPWDIFAHGFMLIAIYHLLKAYKIKGYLNLVLASIFIACSFLSKGPVSSYALLLPFLLSYVIVYKMDMNQLFKTISVIVIGVLIGSLWFVYVRVADPESFLKTITKETSRWSNYNTRPIYYYWSFFVQSGLWSIPAFIGLLFPYLKNKVRNPMAYKFSFLWTIIAVILLSVIPEKKPRYLMPVLIPLAINTGFYIDFLIRNFKTLKDKKETFPVYFNFLLFGGIGLVVPIIGYVLFKEELRTVIFSYTLLSLLLFAIGCLIVLKLYNKNIKQVFYLAVLLFVVIINLLISMSKVVLNQNENYLAISTLRSETSKQQITVYRLDNVTPEILWYYGTKIPLIKKENGIYVFPDASRFGVLVNDEKNLKKETIEKNFSIEKNAIYDLNMANSKSGKYKQRLISHYYVFQER